MSEQKNEVTIFTSNQDSLAAIDPEKRIIYGVSVITRGEARGHSGWVDNDMLSSVADIGNGVGEGVKSRFSHPGFSRDGIGTYLGRAKNFRVDGERVRADLYLSASASKSPLGDLPEYVTSLAKEDPGAFGLSIVFERDIQAEEEFKKLGTYDEDNEKSLRHFRVKNLAAVDVVDEPAANPAGVFSATNEDDGVRDAASLDCETLEEIDMSNEEMQQKLEAAKSEAAAEMRARLKEMKEAFSEYPDGANYALAAFDAGKTVAEAKADKADELLAALAEKSAEVAELTAKVGELENTETDTGTENNAGGTDDVPGHLESGDNGKAISFCAAVAALSRDEGISKMEAVKRLSRKKA